MQMIFNGYWTVCDSEESSQSLKIIYIMVKIMFFGLLEDYKQTHK